MPRVAFFASCLCALLITAFAWFDGSTARGQQQRPQTGGGTTEQGPLPESTAVLEIDNPQRALYRIAIPAPRVATGAATQAEEVSSVMGNDLRLVSLFEVLDPRAFLANQNEGLTMNPTAWTTVGAQGVVKGELRGTTLELRFYEIARGATAAITKTYTGADMRAHAHDFANEIVRLLTGQAGAFGTKLAFARRVGPSRKDVYVADFDGHNVGRVSSGAGVAMLPNFGPGGIWYSVLGATGMFITRSGNGDRPIIGGSGLNMGVSVCGSRAYFASTRDGNSEIYSARTDGSDVRRMTTSPGIDVSPACGPGGQIAFVSDRHGGPQVFVMDGSGGGSRRVTFRGSHNQTPAWCGRADTPLIAFTGRDAGMDVFTVNVATGAYTRLTQGQGVNKDPAFSPDCRMVAFASSRGGIFLSNPEGLNQNLVVRGAAETVRWR